MKMTPIHEIAKQLNAEFTDQNGWQVVHSYGDVTAETAVSQTHVTLSDHSHNGRIRIEGKTAGMMLQADELAIGEGKAVAYGQLYRLRRDLFFVRTAADSVGETAVNLTQQAAAATELITVTNVTHGNAELWLVGPKSAELLSRLCGLDFRDDQFPDGMVKQSSVAKTTQLIIRHDLQRLPAYALIGGRSLAAYMWQTITQAGQDLDIQPIGLAALQQLEAAA